MSREYPDEVSKKDLGPDRERVFQHELAVELTFETRDRRILELLDNPLINQVPQASFQECFINLAKCERHRTIMRVFAEGIRLPVIREAWAHVVNIVLLISIINSNVNIAIFALENGARTNGVYVNLITKQFTESDEERPKGTLLNLACQIGFPRMVQALVDHGTEYMQDYSAIESLCENGNVEILEYFKTKGFDFNMRLPRFDNVSFGFYILNNVFIEQEAHPAEKAFRFMYDNGYITNDQLLDRDDGYGGETYCVAYLLSTCGYDMSYTRNNDIMHAIQEDEHDADDIEDVMDDVMEDELD